MGCGGSKPESTDATPTLTETSAPARRVSSTFTRDGVTLPEGWPEDQPVGKVLLLGGGEAGKSTILKQMHLLYNQDDELDENLFRMWMRRNVIECTKQLVKLAKERELGGLEPADEETILGMDETVATPEQVVKISALWSNGPLKEAMDINRKEPTTWVLDQAGYYLEHVERIFAEDYKPSEVDMVKTRVLTIGVNTVHFTDEVTGPYLMQFVPAAASLISPDDVHLSHTILPWQMIDVGGQRGERRKWLHTLDDVFCVIFTVGLIEYQQVMYEDASMIRMKESLSLFKQWANHKSFSKAPIILALTKKDVFDANFDAAALKKAFPDFDGATAAEGITFIKDKFEDKLAKRDVSAPFKTFVLNTTSKEESLDLLNSVRQLVATHRAGFIMDAVQKAAEKRKTAKGGRRKSTK